jgi:nitrogen fixation/metabolism regulation signal transduction histidine kinase
VSKTFQACEGRRFRESIRYADGRTLPAVVYTAPIRNRSGDLALVLEISADLSEVKRLQEKLRVTQHRYQQLFEAVPCYVSVQDREYKIVDANRRFKEDFGQCIGSRCYSAYKHSSQPCTDCPVAKTFSDGRSHQSEMVISSVSGKPYNVLISTAPLKNESGEITHVIEVSTDITQIRELQDRLSSLGFLIGSISHGVKGLLTGLDAGMYLLNTGFAKQNQEKIQEGWELVQLMVDRIRSMVLDILYYAKERELKWDQVDALRFAKELGIAVEPKLTGHKIEFVREFDPSAGSFEVDATTMRSAIINILENAVEACLSDQSKTNHRIDFKVGQKDNHICFEIADDGTGMDRETREKIFTLFFSSKGHLGTGLGLFIANKIVQQHGGNISVTSEPGRGSQFVVRVPTVLPEYIKSSIRREETNSSSPIACP